MDNKNNDNRSQKEALLEALRDNPRHYSTNNRMAIYCRENGLDELDAWEYLSSVDINDEYKDEIQEVCKSKAVRFVRASFLFDDGPIPGIGIDQARNLFQVLNKIGQDTAKVHVRGADPRTIEHIVDIGIRPVMQKGISVLLVRLCRYIKHSVFWEICGYVPAKEDPSSIIIPIDRDSHIERWLRDLDPGILLETYPGQYESVSCSVIFDETALLVSMLSDRTIMPGIAKAFESWFITDDKTLSYIINHHRLPEGQNRVSYRGNKSDAVRFWKSIGMTPREWNACFVTPDGKDIKVNALATKDVYGDPLPIEVHKDRGIYIPLKEYHLIK